MPRTKLPVGVIFDIIKYAVHDGPGIRTTVFMKGCPLRCIWCQNPESQKIELEKITDVRGRKYAGIFFAQDKNTVGHVVTVKQVVSELKKDAVFYEHSEGGVTFSGGEPLMQPDFLFLLLKESKKQGMHTAVDTSGYAPWSVFKRIMKYVDLFLYDLKLMDDVEHMKYTGVSNSLIMRNLKRLATCNVEISIRFPVITGVTDNSHNLRAIGQFLRGLDSIDRVELLPYNYLCKDKYRRMGKRYALESLEPPSDELLQTIGRRLNTYGLKTRVRSMG